MDRPSVGHLLILHIIKPERTLTSVNAVRSWVTRRTTLSFNQPTYLHVFTDLERLGQFDSASVNTAESLAAQEETLIASDVAGRIFLDVPPEVPQEVDRRCASPVKHARGGWVEGASSTSARRMRSVRTVRGREANWMSLCFMGQDE